MEPLSSCMSLKSAQSSSATEVAGYLYSHFRWAALVDTLDAIEPLCFQAGCHKRRLNLALVFCVYFVLLFFLFSALTLLVGRQKGHPVKSRLVLPFWYRLTRIVSEKGPLDGCVCMCLCFSTFLSIDESVLFCCLRFPYQAVRLLGETSPKWPAVLCRVGCKTATQSVTV